MLKISQIQNQITKQDNNRLGRREDMKLVQDNKKQIRIYYDPSVISTDQKKKPKK